MNRFGKKAKIIVIAPLLSLKAVFKNLDPFPLEKKFFLANGISASVFLTSIGLSFCKLEVINLPTSLRNAKVAKNVERCKNDVAGDATLVPATSA